MAVVRLSTGESNADGLYRKYFTSEAEVTRGGAYQTNVGGLNCVVVHIDLDALPAASGGDEQIVADNVFVPAGAFIEKVDVLVTKEPTTSGSPNLDLGLVDQDGSTEIDFNGLLAATDTWETGTDLGTFVEYVKGTTEVGALVGTKITNTGLITASADTADWTAGQIRVRIWYSIPLSADV